MELKTVYISTKIKDDFSFLITQEMLDYINCNNTKEVYADGTIIYEPAFIFKTSEDSNELEHRIIARLDKKEGYFFTSEELKKLLTDYTNRIIENVETDFPDYVGNVSVNEESITNQLELFLKEIL